MKDRFNDPLLLAGKVLALMMQGAMAIGAAALVIAIPAVLVFRSQIIAKFAAEAGDPAIVFPVLTVAALMLIGLAVVAAMFVFFGRLRQIISTVGDGDPFQPANAERLRLMAWLMLGVQLLFIPAAALGTYLATFADEIEGAHFTFDGGMDLTGILLIIILFILARVFRHGTALREDLEGTV